MLQLNDIAKKRPATADGDDLHDGDDVDGSNYAIPSIVLLVLSLVFLFFPAFVFYLASEAEHAPVTPLERFLLTQLGIYLLLVAASLLLRTAKHPLLIPLTLGSSFSAFLSYNTSDVGSLGALLFVSQLVLSLWGFYSLLFGNEPAYLHTSKTTGADKRTSSFIFGNKAAASSQKKEWSKRMNAED